MPHLPIAKHPEISRRNALILKACKRKQNIIVAEEFNLSKQRITMILKEYDQTKAPQYGRHLTARQLGYIKRARKAGKKNQEIADHLHVHLTTVRRAVARLGLERRWNRRSVNEVRDAPTPQQ